MEIPTEMSSESATRADMGFQLPLDAVPDAMLVINQVGEIVAANTRAEKLFGCSREQLTGKPVESLIPATLRDQHHDHRESYFRDPRVRSMGSGLDLSALRSDGTEVPVDINLSPLTTNDGTFIVAAIRDTTELRRVQELKQLEAILHETRESEDRFRLVSDFAPVMIWMSGTDKLCIYCNKSWLDFTGRSLDQESGNGWAEGIHPDDRQKCIDTYTQAFDRREEFRMEYRVRRHDGEYRWLYDVGVPRFSADRTFAGYIGSCVDVTERRRAEEAARESDERLRLATQAGKMFAYEWDAATDVIVRAGNCPEIFGVLGIDESTSTTGQKILARVHPEDRERLVAEMAALSPARPDLRISYRMVRQDGTVIWLERSSRAYFDEHGKLQRIIGMVADVTVRKLAEEALSQIGAKLIVAQEEERARIARELHDDISQRLALLAMQLDSITQDLPASMVDLKLGIGQAKRQTSELGSDIQALSHRLHSSKLQYQGIVVAARSFCQELSEQHKVDIEFTHSDIPPAVPEDISLCLFRVLQEALGNAVKHSGVRHFEVELRSALEGIHLTVRDAGLGFDPNGVMSKRGLGLISMLERVNMVKGMFSIDSRPEHGTTINVRVPLRAGSEVMRAGV
jgi:PAS domain S-box-containing protein